MEEEKQLSHYQKYKDTIKRCTKAWLAKPENKQKVKLWNQKNQKAFYNNKKLIVENNETQTE